MFFQEISSWKFGQRLILENHKGHMMLVSLHCVDYNIWTNT